MSARNISLFVLSLFYVFGSSASQLELEWQHYTSSPSLKTQLRDYVFVRWDQQADFFYGPLYFDSQIQAEYALDRSKFRYFDIPELYIFYKYNFKQPVYRIESIELNMGRKIKSWSLADEYWNMGLWNSLNRWNPLHPAASGLTGAFLTLISSQWSIDFFLGALHLPHQEAQFIEENGETYSRSRWFYPLPNQVDPLNIDIRYFLRSPSVFDILFQSSYLLSLKTWSKAPAAYYWMKWSAADKPVNHLFYVLNTEGLLKIGGQKGDKGEAHQSVDFFPVRQRLLSMEWGLDYGPMSTAFTLENIKMRETDALPAGWGFLYHRDDLTYFSALLKYNLSPNSFAQLAYIQSWFKHYNINGVNTKAKKPPSVLSRYKALEGIGLDWQTKILSAQGLPRVFALNYRYSFLGRGAWLFGKASYYLSPKIYASVTCDILGAKDSASYFFNRFRHNDYFSWRMAYVF